MKRRHQSTTILPIDFPSRDDSSTHRDKDRLVASKQNWKRMFIVATVVILCSIFYFASTSTSAGIFVKESTTTTTSTISVKEHNSLASCVWSPNNSSECFQLLVGRTTGGGTIPAPRRWLFFGDSTVWRLFTYGGLSRFFTSRTKITSINNACPNEYRCQIHGTNRCGLRRTYGFPESRHTWKPPNFTLGEGPTHFGLNNPDCQDCSGCNSNYFACNSKHVNNTRNSSSPSCAYSHRLLYGGYFSVEFARDVEIQSAKFNTTQENLAQLIGAQYNEASLIQYNDDFGGKPICVIRAGIHDVTIPNMTVAQFRVNSIWYLQVLRPQCSHLIWLPCTAPQQSNDKDAIPGRDKPFLQFVDKMYLYNQAVHDFLQNDQSHETNELRKHVVVVDVFNSSKDFDFASPTDNVHKSSKWYQTFGRWWQELAEKTAKM